MKRVAILGSTGSIGTTALKVIRQYRREFKLEALAVNKNISGLREQIKKFAPVSVAVKDYYAAGILNKHIDKSVCVYSGEEGLEEIASSKTVDIVVIALTGASALKPLLAAIKAGKHIALANKEALVMAGAIIMDELKHSAAKIVPVDSEQSAIFQCLNGRNRDELKKLYLTASGGPLYNVPRAKFSRIKQEKILNHPRWKMGKKITVDSATLMNKGLEVIEARWLFDIEVSNIEVIVHREAIIHSMAEFVDGVVLAQLGVTDMAVPIQYALTYPRRLANKDYSLDFLKLRNLSFDKPDFKKFPCLDFAYSAAKTQGTLPSAMNAANEEAVYAFLDKKINFIMIPKVIEKVMSNHRVIDNPGLAEILKADAWAREEARALIYKDN